MKKIVHIDLNEFFVQAEELSDPSLVGKKVAVGYSGRRGVISTASYEARACGVHSGQPVFQAREKCPGLIIVNGHFSLYQDLSRRFMSYLRARFPRMEPASIDECYLDLSDFLLDGKEEEQLFDLQMDIYRNTGLKCSIGEGATLFLAKMGSDMKKPLGLTLLPKEKIPTLLWPLPIDKMYGIGKKTAPGLVSLGIRTIGDLALTQNPDVKKYLGGGFEEFQGEANGLGNDFVDTSDWDPKSISSERTFADDVEGYEELGAMVTSCVKEDVKELDQYHKSAMTLEIKLRTPDFKTKSRRCSFPRPLYRTEDLLRYALDLFDQFYKGQKIRLLGVGLEKLQERKEDTGTKKKEELNQINESLSFGGKVFFGSDLLKEKKDEGK
ncbi:MAG: DNA polymerase IV [Bacilli bacterium]